MLGVAALGLDAGVDAIVLLAGTQTALWDQTYDRFRAQLDYQGSEFERERRRVLLPNPQHRTNGEYTDTPLSRMYAFSEQKARRSISRRVPIVAIVMKNVHHLRAFSETVQAQLMPAIVDLDRPYHLLVLDDEADDGSILDARVESGLDPRTSDLKQIPRAIVDMWERRPHKGATAAPNLAVTYIGYTATPQANFLQSDHNPLAPREFVVSLRTPYDSGNEAPRTTTFHEPTGIKAYYTGGEIYYRRLAAPSLCVSTSGAIEEDIASAVRAFLMAGAIRLWREGTRLLPSQARATSFDSPNAARSHSPRPHSMLFHPSASVQDHFEAAAAILMWAADLDLASATSRLAAGQRDLPVQELTEMIESDEAPWRAWILNYQESAEAVQFSFDLSSSPVVPTDADWAEIKQLLLAEVLPATRIAIVNSDPAADDRPEFDPYEDRDGWQAPTDLSTIFVSGNVMSRGLTLEGLTTTLFLRHSHTPFADTQAQMQRWFGYRGEHLELNRVFLPAEQLNLFRAYHENDEALRRQVIAAMNTTPGSAPNSTVLSGLSFHSTGKLADVQNIPLCPSAAPFIRILNDGADEDPNTQLVSETLRQFGSDAVTVNGRTRGRILKEPFTLLEAASLLDQLRYDRYHPGPDTWQADRWRALESHLGLDESSDTEHLLPLYRPPHIDDRGSTEARTDCPYAISAYLRVWHACLTRRARGLFGTDDADIPWSMVDLAEKSRTQPAFYIGVRYGSGPTISRGALAKLPFEMQSMRRDIQGGELTGAWGSRNPGQGDGGYFGDQFFDYHARGAQPPPSAAGDNEWRPAGAPGLILFHLIDRGTDHAPATAVGVVLPIGGPDQFAAWSRKARS
ncbi:Z1 domain-containing protein [Aeromicrobium sp.]|uniref:Z1 domain-containing protein n=1 Tax=Aeromicrobium sp. TaxID=1871063 RepID=UPI002FC8F1D1